MLKSLFAAGLAITVLSGTAASANQAANWPQKPIKVIVGIPAGQSTDMLMRMLAQQIEPLLGQPVVVENRPGAAGAIAMRQLSESPADGYTLALAFSASFSAIPHVRKDPGYKISQFDPISSVAAVAQVLITPYDSQFRNLNDLMAYAREKPKALNYGTAGIATMSHLTIEMLNGRAGVEMEQIVYQGGPQATTDLIGGRIQLYADSIPGATPHINSGKIRALAVSTNTRQPFLPDVPTVEEQGFEGFNVLNWMGVVAPKGVPEPVLDKLNDVINQALRDPAFNKQLVDRGFIVLGGTRKEFGDFIASEHKSWGEVIKKAGIRIE